MAKLTNVMTVDMVNGEITKVAYDGAEYAKVDSGEKGDIAVIVEAWGDQVIGEHYFVNYRKVDGDSDVFIGIDKGRYREYVGYERRMNYFRKISAPTLEERVTSLESDVAALKSGKSSLKGEKVEAHTSETSGFKEGAKVRVLGLSKFGRDLIGSTGVIDRPQKSDGKWSVAIDGSDYICIYAANDIELIETIEFEGAQYRKVDREAREGDVVMLTKYSEYNYTEGKTYLVQKYRRIKDIDGDIYDVYNSLVGRTRQTVDVYEPIEQAKYIPQVGGIVVVTGNTPGHSNSVGDIGKVGAEKPLEDGGVKVYVPGNSTVAIRTKPQDIRKATPVEVEAYEKAAHKASFAVGDYVKVVKSFVGYEGEIAKITEIGEFTTDKGAADFVIEHLPKKNGDWAIGSDCVVKATDVEIAEATAPKLKAGDYVKITRVIVYDTTKEKAYEVFENECGRLYYVDDAGDKRYGAITAGDYEIVDAETAKWAKIGRKVGEFKEGDIVRVTKSHGGHPVGTIGKLVPAPEYIGTDLGVLANGHKKSHISGMELIAPVESTLN
ncbi:hypothetical protein ACIQXW_23240 [Lysinibacillus sp. NPDC097162]|uniref:hypothetical protein n=1 Tax=Lysinibacillus sp. NPDC097162 TaxID=3364140 RepID=UPI00380AA75B